MPESWEVQTDLNASSLRSKIKEWISKGRILVYDWHPNNLFRVRASSYRAVCVHAPSDEVDSIGVFVVYSKGSAGPNESYFFDNEGNLQSNASEFAEKVDSKEKSYIKEYIQDSQYRVFKNY